MKRSYLIPLGLLVAVLIALPALALTESQVETEVKEALGVDVEACAPPANLASRWIQGPSLSLQRDEPRTAVINGNAYLVGGTLGVVNSPGNRLLLTPSEQVTRFNPRTGSYTELAPLPEALNHVGIADYRGRLYVLGGYGRRVDAHTGRAFYRYDLRTDTWSRLPDMPEPRAAMAVGVIGHELIVAGGARDRVPLASTYAYDFHSGSWSRLPDMGSRREHVGKAVAGAKLYVLGGRTPQSLAVDTAERYNPAKRRWEDLPPMPVPVGGVAAVNARGEVIAIGGGDDGRGTVSAAVQSFDPANGAWSLLPGMRTGRHGHGAAFVAGRIWVFGGSDCAYYHATDSVESLPIPVEGE